jgi:anthranilate phosphoribosyltransferase
MNIQAAIQHLIAGENLSHAAMTDVMRAIMQGEATDVQIAGFLVALRIKGETVDEIAAAAGVMRELSAKVVVKASKTVDTCGTGGDGAGIFNVSTGASFIVAAAGANVAKHGNRSVTSTSGSADVLEAAGVNLDLTAEQVARAIDEIGLGFMFAVKHHSAMKYTVVPRRELAVRTIFNLLGPLTNPAGSKYQVMGVYDKALLRPIAEVLRKLGSVHALVVHAEDGLDELSIAGLSYIAELKNGEILEYTVRPEDFGLQAASLESLVVSNAAESLALIKDAIVGNDSVAADMLALNAGAAIYAADITASLAAGVSLAQDLMQTGQALEKMREFVEFTQLAAASEN